MRVLLRALPLVAEHEGEHLHGLPQPHLVGQDPSGQLLLLLWRPQWPLFREEAGVRVVVQPLAGHGLDPRPQLVEVALARVAICGKEEG